MKLELEDFRHGKYKYEPKPGELRLVKDNNMWGYVDDEGNVVIPARNESALVPIEIDEGHILMMKDTQM